METLTWFFYEKGRQYYTFFSFLVPPKTNCFKSSHSIENSFSFSCLQNLFVYNLYYHEVAQKFKFFLCCNLNGSDNRFDFQIRENHTILRKLYNFHPTNQKQRSVVWQRVWQNRPIKTALYIEGSEITI